MLSWRWLHRDRKSQATVLSVLTFWVVGLTAVALLQFGKPGAAGIVCLVGWQIAYSLDCLDGAIARCYGTLSRAGAGVDALADNLSMVAVTLVGLLALLRSGTPEAMLLLFVAGQVGRCAGPLWTVSDRLAAQPAAARSPAAAGKVRQISRLAWFGLKAVFDYNLVLLVLAVAVLTNSPGFWIVTSVFVGASGVAISLAAFTHLLITDEFR